MDGPELARWKRFAAKGGIGTCVALGDCAAETQGDLMFFQNDEIVVLMPLQDQEGAFIGYCEGVVGRFFASDVKFLTKLRKAVPNAARQNTHSPTASSSHSHSSSLHAESISSHATGNVNGDVPLPLPALDEPTPNLSPLPSAGSTPRERSPMLSPEERRFSASSGPDSGSPHTPGDIPHPLQSRPSIKEERVEHDQHGDEDPSTFATNELSAPPPNGLAYPPSSTGPLSLSPRTADFPDPLSLSPRSAEFPDQTHLSSSFSDAEHGIGMQFIQGLISRALEDQQGAWSEEEESLAHLPQWADTDSEEDEERERDQSGRRTLSPAFDLEPEPEVHIKGNASLLTDFPAPPTVAAITVVDEMQSEGGRTEEREESVRDHDDGQVWEHDDHPPKDQTYVASRDQDSFAPKDHDEQGPWDHERAPLSDFGDDPPQRPDSQADAASVYEEDQGPPHQELEHEDRQSHAHEDPHYEDSQDQHAQPFEHDRSFDDHRDPSPHKDEDRQSREEDHSPVPKHLRVEDEQRAIQYDEPETFDHPNEVDHPEDRNPSAPLKSPSIATSGTESALGYYEEDVDIYDDYRYSVYSHSQSRFSMTSKKSRKSVVPDVKTMPVDAKTMPSADTRSLKGEILGSPPPDDVQSLPSFTPEKTRSEPEQERFDAASPSPPPTPLSREASPSPTFLDINKFTFPPPLALKPRSPEFPQTDELRSPTSPTNPIRSARSTMFATALRQQFEDEENRRIQAAEGDEMELPPLRESSMPENMILPSEDQIREMERAFGELDPEPEEERQEEPTEEPVEEPRLQAPDMKIDTAISRDSDSQSSLQVPERRFVDPSLPLPVGVDPSIPTRNSHFATSPAEYAYSPIHLTFPPKPSSTDPPLPPDDDFHRTLRLERSNTNYLSASGRPIKFLPHPFAPRRLAFQTKPSQPLIYIRKALGHHPPIFSAGTSPVLVEVMDLAAKTSLQNLRSGGRMVALYGRTAGDLALLDATGPVLMEFAVDGVGDWRCFEGSVNLVVPSTPSRRPSEGTGEIPFRPRPRSQSFGGFGMPAAGNSPSNAPENKPRLRMPSIKSMWPGNKGSPVPARPPATISSIGPPMMHRGPNLPPLMISRDPQVPAALASPFTPGFGPGPMTPSLPQSPAIFRSQDEASLGVSDGPLAPPISPQVGLRSVGSVSSLGQGLASPSPIGRTSINASPMGSSRSQVAAADTRELTLSPKSINTQLADDESIKTSSVGRSQSLRSKVSIAAMRKAQRSATKDVDSTPGTPSMQYQFHEETVQVNEGGAAAEFELVRPVLRDVPEAGSREDFSAEFDQTSSRSEPESPERERPPFSPLPRASPFTEGGSSFSHDPAFSLPDPGNAETHRVREQKWLAAMSSVSPSQARKNKKVKKLVQEGVPNSVRSVVWLYLTNSKARRMDGLYTQLCARGGVSASEEIKRDADRSFPTHPHLRDPDGPIVSLLQAYLTMVPDIRYQQGLAAMAGTILLQSPEEDSFWTFIAVLDNHLRGYFAINSSQMVIDAKLFQKALENIDAPLAKKLFNDLGVNPVDLCHPWFSALFVNSLPNRYLYRVWDIFLCNGVYWLFRVGLTILLGCRQIIMAPQSSKQELHNLLFRPPPSVLNTDPDAFVAAALLLKLKEDDLTKLRGKLEASFRQYQGQNSRPGGVRSITRLAT